MQTADDSSIIVARLTPSGQGAIATTLLKGPGAFELLTKYFQQGKKTLHDRETIDCLSENSCKSKKTNDWTVLSKRPLFGRLRLAEGMEEEVVVHLVTWDHFEIHSHGGSLVCDKIMATFTNAGAVPLSWENMILTPSPDLPFSSDDEVFTLLPFARTERAVELLLRQQGDFLKKTLGLIEQDALQGKDVQQRLVKLLERGAFAKYLTCSFPVLLLGPTNAGKSSLINALCGYNRAIVDSQAGTTRDTISLETVLGGQLVQLTDTAGFRRLASPLEMTGMNLAVGALGKAELILMVFDVTKKSNLSPLESFEQLLAELVPAETLSLIRNKRTLIVANKSDIPIETWHPFWRDHFHLGTQAPCGPIYFTHTQSSSGVALLSDAILSTFVPDDLSADAPIPLSSRQMSWVTDLVDRLLW